MVRMLSPGGVRARLSILIFHRVLPAPDPLLPDIFDAERFDAVCGWLHGWFNVLPLDEAVRRLRDDSLPARAAAITFDDGYADNHDVALPILRRHGISATFFVGTGYLDGGRMFNDSVVEALRGASKAELDLRATAIGDLGCHDISTIEARRGLIGELQDRLRPLSFAAREAFCEHLQQAAGCVRMPQDLMMSSQQVRSLHRAGMQIGAHTVLHPILARLDDQGALSEMRQSREMLEGLLDQPVRLFAYPNGRPDQDYSARTVELARSAGFDAAVSTAWGVATRRSDPFQLPRFTPWDRSRTRFGLRMLMNLRRGPEARATA